MKKQVVGKEEWCSLPELGLPILKARVDSGAKTSSLHAFHIHPFERDGVPHVRFKVHPIQHNREIVRSCEAEVVDRREVKSTSGISEKRYVIRTALQLGSTNWPIEVTLTNRDSMGYRMLLGREAMRGRMLVDPAKRFCVERFKDAEAEKLYGHARVRKRSLHILVLASNPELYSNQRLMEAGRARGHEMRFINISHCYMNISCGEPQVFYRGGDALIDVDAVIPRIRPAHTFYGCAVVRQFQTMGVFCLNDSVAIARSRDKLRSLQMLARKGINMPVTGFAHSPQDTKALIRMVGGAPVIVKLLEGTQGRGVVLAETDKAAESVINAFKSLDANILAQEFIQEARGRDIRCFVIGDKVVGSIQREAAAGEFRANLHLGGSASTVRVTSEERKLAIEATRILGLDVAGVDIIRSKNGPKVLEINSSPGLEGIESVTGKDIAGMMIECIEKRIGQTGKRRIRI
jgi:ribosomal protein S6--L-glutamate ligase